MDRHQAFSFVLTENKSRKQLLYDMRITFVMFLIAAQKFETLSCLYHSMGKNFAALLVNLH